MQVKINRTRFVEALRNLSMVVASDPSFTNSLSYVVMKRADGNINLVGADGSATMSVDVEPVEADGIDAPVMLPLGMMLRLLSRCDADDVEFSADDPANGVVMKCGNCKTRIRPLANPDIVHREFSYDFSTGAQAITIKASDAFTGLDTVSVAMYTGTLDRPELRGVLMEDAVTDDGHVTRFVATNGVQVSAYKVDVAPAKGRFRATLVAKYVPVVAKMLKDETDMDSHVGFTFDGGRLFVIARRWRMSLPVNSRDFPDWTRFLPDNSQYQPPVVVDPKAMLGMMERVDSVIGSELGSFTMGFEGGELKMSGVNLGTETHVTDHMPTGYKGENILFSCNPKLFINVLKKMPHDADMKVYVGWRGDIGVSDFMPITLDDGTYTAIVLPFHGNPTHG